MLPDRSTDFSHIFFKCSDLIFKIAFKRQSCGHNVIAAGCWEQSLSSAVYVYGAT